MAVTVLLADDHPIVRQGLRHLLETQPDFKVVGEASDGLKASQMAERYRPDVLVVDLMMPGLNGLEVTRTYQYSNFGVPGLGLKRGLSDDTVIAPYATGLAAMVGASAAVRNYAALDKVGARGVYGYYEALDYTPARRPEGEPVAVVRAYMAHHQGMTLVSLLNTLCDGIMRAYFHSEPIVQATELLLQERTPRGVAVAHPRAEEVHAASNVRELVPPVQRQFRSAHSPVPRTHLLGSGTNMRMRTLLPSCSR